MEGIAGGAGATTRVVAHRGFHAPLGLSDNSMGAFQAAVNLGADVLETDIRRTRDGVLVVYHDAKLPDGRKLEDLDHAQLPPLADGQHIPLLREVADLARRSNVRLAAEFKERGYEEQAVRELVAYMPVDRIELISFYTSSVQAVERLDPKLRTGLLEPRLPEWLRESPLYPAALWVFDKLGMHPSLDTAARVGADYVSVERKMATRQFIAEAHRRGVKVDVWTVNDATRMAELLADGADGIVTDRPDVLLGLMHVRSAA